jgi:hypothetical protein
MTPIAWITLSPGEQFVKVEDIPKRTSRALYPSDNPGLITAIFKILASPEPTTDDDSDDWDSSQLHRETDLTDDDWVILNRIWSNLPPLRFPLSLECWPAYGEAFNEAENRPAWGIKPWPTGSSNPELPRIHMATRHERQLLRAIKDGRITPSPLTHQAQNNTVVQMMPRKDSLVSVEEFSGFAAGLGIGVRTLASVDAAALPSGPPTAESTATRAANNEGAQATVLHIGINSKTSLDAYIRQRSREMYSADQSLTKGKIAQDIAAELRTKGYQRERPTDDCLYLSAATIEKAIPAGLTGGRAKNRRKKAPK